MQSEFSTHVYTPEHAALAYGLDLEHDAYAWSLLNYQTSTHGYVVYDQNTLVGVLIFAVTEGAEVLRLCVHRSYRRQGIASHLLQKVCNEYKQVVLEVRSDNTEAIALYFSLGFGEIGERKHYYSDRTNAKIMQFQV